MPPKSSCCVGVVLLLAAGTAAADDGLWRQALTLEQKGEFSQARSLYEQAAQTSEPQARRAALLGLARVARGQMRLDEARDIYRQLLARDTADVESINGLAWADLADHDVAEARTGFGKALTLQPGNAEATAGLVHAGNTWRYQLDVKGSYLHNDLGGRGGGSVVLAAALDARQSVEAALRRNAAEEGLIDRPLTGFAIASTAARISYRWQQPGLRSFTLAYEQVDRQGLPGQHRLSAAADVRVSEGVRLTGGVRQSSGTGWHSQLFHLGVGVALGSHWEAVATAYSERDKERDTQRRVVALEAVRQGPGRMLLVFGASHGRAPRASEVYGRAVLPLTAQGALLLTARRLTLNRESQLEIGWRHSWN